MARNRKLPKKTRKNEEQDENIEKLEQLIDRMEDMTTKSRLKDMAYHFSAKREIIKSNLIAGIARGVGLTIGTAVLLALLGFILAQTVSLPLIGDYLAEFLDIVDNQRETTP